MVTVREYGRGSTNIRWKDSDSQCIIQQILTEYTAGLMLGAKNIKLHRMEEDLHLGLQGLMV